MLSLKWLLVMVLAGILVGGVLASAVLTVTWKHTDNYDYTPTISFTVAVNGTLTANNTSTQHNSVTDGSEITYVYTVTNNGSHAVTVTPLAQYLNCTCIWGLPNSSQPHMIGAGLNWNWTLLVTDFDYSATSIVSFSGS